MLPFIGILQFGLVLLILLVPALHSLTPLITGSLFEASAVIGAVSFAFLMAIGNLWKLQTYGVCEVRFADKREEGGSLEVTYMNPSGYLRQGMLVKEVKPHESPLMLDRGSGRWSHQVPIEGTEAHLEIFFSNSSRSVSFGFPSREEMNGVYTQLSTETLQK